MYNCSLESVVGYSARGSLFNSAPVLSPGVIFSLANSIWHYDGSSSRLLKKTNREINVFSRQGHQIIIGEKVSKGELLSTVLFDVRTPEAARTFTYQKTKLQHIALSLDGKFLVSVGAADQQTQQLMVIQTHNQAEVGTRVYHYAIYKRKEGKVVAVEFAKTTSNMFAILFQHKLVFMFLREDCAEEIQAKVSRVRQFTGITFANDHCYLSSRNGDIAEVSLEQFKQTRVGPRKRIIINGILHIKFFEPNYLIISGTKGFLGLVDTSNLTIIREMTLSEQIVGLTEVVDNVAYLSSSRATIYKLGLANFEVSIFYTCHSSQIKDIKYLSNYDQVFVSCAGGEIIVWKADSFQPQVRIAFSKIQCLTLDLPRSGKYIISGWSDDSIRIFAPKDGKLLHHLAQLKLGEVTKVLSVQISSELVAGGSTGMIRKYNNLGLKVLSSMGYHSKQIHCLKTNKFKENQMVSCGEDGHYAVWNLKQSELIFACAVSNFLKEVHFLDEFTIRLVGSGGVISTRLISNGKVLSQAHIDGSFANVLINVRKDTTMENLLFYGGEEPYLSYFDQQFQRNLVRKVDAFGEITAMSLSPNEEKIVAGTANGIMLSYEVFSVKKSIDPELQLKWADERSA